MCLSKCRGGSILSEILCSFFTIPVGYFLGGFLVDNVFEPLMGNTQSGLLKDIFGSGKGSGAAMLFFFMAVSGVIVCLIFRRIKALRELE